MKKLTEIAKTKAKAARTVAAIVGLLCISEAEYNILIYNMGLEYLHALYAAPDDSVLPHEHSPMFWNWWKIGWRNRDELFLYHIIDHVHITGENAPNFVMQNPLEYFIAAHQINPSECHPGMHIIREIEKGAGI